MALQRQIVPIDFTGGIENKRDPRLALTGRFTQVVNGKYDTADTISKREATTALAASGVPSAAMWKYKDTLLLAAASRSTVQEYAAAAATWQTKGYLSLDTVTSKQVIRNTSTQSAPDCASVAGISIWAWEDTRGGIRISVFDEATGAAYLADVQLTATGYRPRCVAVGTTLAVLYTDSAVGTKLLVSRVFTTSPTVIQAAVTISTNAQVGASARLDAQRYPTGTDILVVHRRSSDDTIDLTRITIAGVIVAGPTNLAHIPTGALAAGVFADGTAAAIWSDTVQNTGVSTYDGALTLRGSVLLDPTATQNTVKITSKANGANLLIIYEATAAATYNHMIKTVTINNAAAITTANAVFLRGLGLATHAFLFDSEIHVGAVFDSALQPTFFVVGVTGGVIQRVVAKALVWRSGGLLAATTLPHVLNEATATVSLALVEKGRLAFKDGIDITPKGISRLDLGSVATSWRSAVEYNDLLYVAAACPMIYDGFSIVEENFHVFPENYTLTDQGAGALSAGTYQYVVVYEWVDGRGRRHNSVAGVAASIVLAAAHQVRVTIPTLRLTRKRLDAAASEASCVVYRTVADGTIFYRLGSVVNTTAADTVLLDDNAADTSIIANEILYTTGGALDNEPCPPCRAFTVHQDRLWVIGLEDPLKAAFSKQRVEGEGTAGFNEVFQGTVPGDYGSLSGIASMDNKLILFAERGIWGIAGEGPNALGQQNSYTDPVKIPAEVGCTLGAAKSVAADPQGVWFLSPRGLRLLGRTLELMQDADGKPLGADVDSLATACVAAVAHPSKPQVLFYVGSGNALVWDHQWRRWSQYTNMACVDAAVYAGVPAIDPASGTVRLLNNFAATLDDNAGAYQLVVETGWVKLAAVQGFQRAYAALLLGDFSIVGGGSGGHGASVTVNSAVNYVESYDAPPSFAATPGPQQIRHDFPIQKCSAIRLKITVDDPDGNGNFCTLSNLSLDLGLKPGKTRLGSAQQF